MSAPGAGFRLPRFFRGLLPVATGVGMILAWYAVCIGLSADHRFLLPSPREVAQAFV